MTHATISHHSRLHCIVEFTYNEQAKDTVKALPGSNFHGNYWLVAVMHLPTLKTVFTKLTVAPEVVAAYHTLLGRMLKDLQGLEDTKDAKELMRKHNVGIAALQGKSAQMTLGLR